MKIFILVAVVALLVFAVECHRERGRGGRAHNSGRHRRGPKTCEQITKRCENMEESSNRRARMFGKRTYGQVCASKDGEYATYNKTMCSMTKAVKCDNVTIVHKGKCGECTDKNLCPTEARLAEMKKKVKEETSEWKNTRLQKAIKRSEATLAKQKKLCTVSGLRMTLCEFNTAKCNAAAKGEDLPVKKIACVCNEEGLCPQLGKMKNHLVNLKRRPETLSGNRKSRLERQISWKDRMIKRKQCYCDYRLALCKAQEDETTPPPKSDCKNMEE